MIVVSDTSAIRALAFLDLLHLLADFYGEIVIPPAVDRELRSPPGLRFAVDIHSIDFINVMAPIDQEAVAQLRREIDLESQRQSFSLGKSRRCLF